MQVLGASDMSLTLQKQLYSCLFVTTDPIQEAKSGPQFPKPPVKSLPEPYIEHNNKLIHTISEEIGLGDRSPWCVYVLESILNWDSSCGCTYTGETKYLPERLRAHNKGTARSKTTKQYLPYRVAAVVSGLSNEEEARDLEHAMKGYTSTYDPIHETLPPQWSFAQKKVRRLQRLFQQVRQKQPAAVLDVFISMPDGSPRAIQQLIQESEAAQWPKIVAAIEEEERRAKLTPEEREAEDQKKQGDFDARFYATLDRMALANKQNKGQ